MHVAAACTHTCKIWWLLNAGGFWKKQSFPFSHANMLLGFLHDASRLVPEEKKLAHYAGRAAVPHLAAAAPIRQVTPQKWVQCSRCQKWRKVSGRLLLVLQLLCVRLCIGISVQHI